MENIRLREVRESRGMSQDALADFSGVTQREIVDIEKGRRRPYKATLDKLAEALDCEVDEIIGERKCR